MQIFLPYADFARTAKVLDKRRLFKQLIECRQVLATMGVQVSKNDGGFYKPSHRNHPIHKIWDGYDDALKIYHDFILFECLERGIKTSPRWLFSRQIEILGDWTRRLPYPMLIGYEPFHMAMRSNLLRKDPKWYDQFGWTEPNDLPYMWTLPTDVLNPNRSRADAAL